MRIRITPKENLIDPEDEVAMKDAVNEESDAVADKAKLTAKLKKCELDIQLYVAALQKEKLELMKRIAKYQAHEETLCDRIALLEKELTEKPPKAETPEEQIKRLTGQVVNVPVSAECLRIED